MSERRKPTRHDLLVAIGELQDLMGQVKAANHDRNPNRQAEVDGLLQLGHDYCVAIRNFDSPVQRRSPWSGSIVPRGMRFI